jgi:hypothetical protein
MTGFEYGMMVLGLRGITLRPFRLLRVFKAMIRVRTFSAIKSIIKTLKQGVGQARPPAPRMRAPHAAVRPGQLPPLTERGPAFVHRLRCIFGMAALRKSFRRRCVTTARAVPRCAAGFANGWALPDSCDLRSPLAAHMLNESDDESDAEPTVIGGYPFVEVCDFVANSTAGQYDGRYPVHAGRYHTCQLDDFLATGAQRAMCAEGPNPQFGLQHFDHIGGAVLAVFQIAAPDAPHDIIWRAVESESESIGPALWVFFITISCSCTFLLLGLFVAVVTGTFKRVREGQGAQMFANKVAAIEMAIETHVITDNKNSALSFLGENKNEHQKAEAAFQLAASRLLLSNRFRNFSALAILSHCGVMSAPPHVCTLRA